MQLKEVQRKTGLSEKAIKHYEKEGLLQVLRLENNYRDYSEEDVKLLHQISVYRKLGIEVATIKMILQNKQEEATILTAIIHQKQVQLIEENKQIECLKKYLSQDTSISELNSMIEYDCIANGLKELLPGYYGEIFLYHFLPYLQMPLATQKQKEAYHTLIDYFENVQIPFSLKVNKTFMRFLKPMNAKTMSEAMDKELKKLIEMSESDFEKLKKQVWQGYQHQQSFFYKYGPAGIGKRKMMKALKKCGYYDILLPAMEDLSPSYHEYRTKLFEVNQKVCDELHLAYDDNFNLIQV